MDIDPRISMGSVGPGSQAQEVAGDPNLGKNEFVQLLMAQLAHQDPTDPQDSSAFVAQLAQFANVELAQQQAAQLEALLVAQAANNQTATTQLVGKEVLYMAEEITISADATPDIVLDVEQPAENVRLTLVDESGREFSVRVPSNLPAGRFTATPVDLNGEPLPPGTYHIEPKADDGQGNSINIVPAIRAHVDGVSFSEGYAQLLVGGIMLPLSDVIEVLDPGGATGTGLAELPTGLTGDSSNADNDDLVIETPSDTITTDGSSSTSGGDTVFSANRRSRSISSSTRHGDAATTTVPVTNQPVRTTRNGLPFPYSSRGY